MTTSKKLVWLIVPFAVLLSAVTAGFALAAGEHALVITAIVAPWTALAATAVGFYFNKAKAENAIKIERGTSELAEENQRLKQRIVDGK
jgi:hypothetical protein